MSRRISEITDDGNPHGELGLNWRYGVSAPIYLSNEGPVMSLRSNRVGPAYEPTTNFSATQLELEGSKSVYQHFHSPWNQHNRFLAEATATERVAYRDIERMPPPPFEKGNSIRPSTAPSKFHLLHSSKRGIWYTQEEATRLATGLQSVGPVSLTLTTSTGTPNFTIPLIVDADVEDGKPGVYLTEEGEERRSARVQAYVVPPHPLGFGEGGSRSFHQDYRHYKYYGFGGKGAKTSWGYNPKYNHMQSPVYPAGNIQTKQNTARSRILDPPHSKMIWNVPPSEIIEPFLAFVDMESSKKINAKVHSSKGTPNRARVATYRIPATRGYTNIENQSPHFGSQSVFTQRYSHYKYNGFAGKGAVSSWARNPKYAIMEA